MVNLDSLRKRYEKFHKVLNVETYDCGRTVEVTTRTRRDDGFVMFVYYRRFKDWELIETMDPNWR